MQTYLPYPDFQQSAAALDTTRLGKQRVEALQILRTLVIPGYGRLSHPAVRMWMGHVPALTSYALAMTEEWIGRGHPDNLRESIMEFAPEAADPDAATKIDMPLWLGEPDFHASHRSKLLQKDSRFYDAVFANTPTDLELFWPEPSQEVFPEDPYDDFVWVLRAPQSDVESGTITTVGMPAWGKAEPVADTSDVEQPTKAEAKAPKRLTKKPTRNRKIQDEAFRTVPGNTTVLVALEDGAKFALGKIQGRPITLDDGRFGRNFELQEIIDRSDFNYPALLQDPRVFFPIPGQ